MTFGRSATESYTDFTIIHTQSSICGESATGIELWLEHWHRGNFGHISPLMDCNRLVIFFDEWFARSGRLPLHFTLSSRDYALCSLFRVNEARIALHSNQKIWISILSAGV